jgi:hypothetical protein
MDCICTFWVCPIGTHPKHCPGLPGEVMLQSENGYKDTGPRKPQEREKEFPSTSSMKLP